jgi:hypothetical protein
MLRYVWNICNVIESRNTKEPDSAYYKCQHSRSLFDDSETENVNEGIKCRPHICGIEVVWLRELAWRGAERRHGAVSGSVLFQEKVTEYKQTNKETCGKISVAAWLRTAKDMILGDRRNRKDLWKTRILQQAAA